MPDRGGGSTDATPAAERGTAAQLVDSIGGVLWEADAESLRFRFISGRAEQLFGHPARRWYEDPGFWPTCLHPEDRERVLAAYRSAPGRPGEHALDYRATAADGRTVWIRDLFTVVSREGEPATLRGVMVDTTESKRIEDTLWNLVRGMALATGDNFFRELTLHLANTLRVRCAAVTEVPTDEPGRLRLLAAWNREEWEEPFAYDVAGTPCEHVLQGREAVCFPNHVAEMFPRDAYLVEHNVHSYLGAPLIGASGRVIGALCVYDDRPLLDTTRAKSLLRVFAARAASELDRQRAERALFQSEVRYRKIFQTAPVGLWELDLSGIRTTVDYWKLQGIEDLSAHLEAHPELVRETVRLLRPLNVNEAGLRIFRAKSREELLRADVQLPETVTALRDWLLAIAEGRPSFAARTCARAMDGTRLDVWVTMTLPRQAAEFARVPASVVDVTDQVRSETRERERERRVRRQNAALLALAKRDELAEGDFVGLARVATRTAAETLGVARVGVWLFERDRTVLRCHLLFESGNDRYGEGTELEATHYPRYFEALRGGRVVAAEDALADPSTREFRETYLGPLGIGAMLDAPVRRGGKLVGVVCHEHVGPARRWLADERDFAASVADFVSLALESHERRLAEEAVREAQQQLLIRQREEGRKVQAELEKVKDQLVRRTRLAAIGQVAASIAHELRNPLGAIRNAEYFLRRRAPTDRPEWVECLDIVRQEIHSADRIVSNLLEMSRGKDPALQRLDLGRAAREAFEGVPRGDGLKLTLDLDPDPFEVHADPGQLAQVLGNLFTNAVQAIVGDGEIAVRARRDGGFDAIEVRDTGPGIAEGIRASVFEPLFTTKAKGTGLGLPICRQIVERHGGSIELMTAEGPGAAIVIRLPRRRSDESARRGSGTRRSVLVVDDERNMRASLAHVLRDEGYEVHTADSGERAVRMCGRREFDVVLMDVRMPGIDGVEAFRRIRRKRADARVIMMSAYSLEEVERAALAEGAMAFVRKPLDVESMVELIGNLRRNGESASN